MSVGDYTRGGLFDGRKRFNREKEKGEPQGERKKVRVLIADNDQAYRGFLRNILLKNPDIAAVAEAGDAEEALRMARRLKPDLILTDFGLPGPDGLDVARRLKKESNGARVIFLAAVSGDAVQKASRKYGADACVRKDMDVSQLLSVIRHTAEAA